MESKPTHEKLIFRKGTKGLMREAIKNVRANKPELKKHLRKISIHTLPSHLYLYVDLRVAETLKNEYQSLFDNKYW